MAVQPGPLLRALLPQFVPPPPTGSRHHLGAGPMHVDVCETCHGAAAPGTAVCASCRQRQTEVTSPVSLIVPISLYRQGPSDLETLLYVYKTTLRRPGDPAAKQAVWQLAATLACFLDGHHGCLEQEGRGSWDAITTVPPTRSTRSDSEHPLVEVIRLLADLHLPTRNGPRQWAEEHLDVLTPGPAAARLAELHATDDGFLVQQPSRVRGRRLLLVDDLLISGAHLQSAASALTAAGATVVAAVVVGRRLDVRADPWARRLWDQLHRELAARHQQPAGPPAGPGGDEQRQLAYFDSCCLEEPRPRQASLL